MKLRLQTLWHPLAALALLGLSASASAQISLSSAVDLAFKSDPKILSAQADVDHARAALTEAKDAYVPVIGMTGGFGSSTGVPLGLPTLFSASSQSLLFNWSQRDYIHAAHSGVDAARSALQQAQDDAAEDVVTTYLALDYAQLRRAAAQEALGHAQHLLKVVNDRVAAGEDPHVQIPRTHLTVIDLQQQVLHIDSDIAELSDHLGRLTGLAGTSPAVVHGSIPDLPDMDYVAPASGLPSLNPAVRAAFATAQSKFQTAHGEGRYLYLPQISIGANYTRVTTDFTNYAQYYPGFDAARIARLGLSLNSLGVGISVQLPLVDQGHKARARQAVADAHKAQYDAQAAQNAFLEGRLKLARAAGDLELQAERAKDNAEIAQDDLDAVLVQLQPGAVPVGTQPLTPEDEAKARLAVAQKKLDLLNAQLQLDQTKLQLMRQNGQLAAWLNSALLKRTTLTQP